MKAFLMMWMGALALATCGNDEPIADKRPAPAIAAPRAATITQTPSQSAAATEGTSSASTTDQSAARGAPTAAANQTYVVQKGDTLYGIAASRDITAADLASWNDISDPRRLRIGQELRLTTTP